MAQRVKIELVDDLDGGDASETVAFALDGNGYEIDLSDSNAAELRNCLARYIGAGRKTQARRGRRPAGMNVAAADKAAAGKVTKSAKKAASSRGGRNKRVATMDEIEAAKS